MMNFSHLYSSALDQELGTDDSTQLFTDARRKRAINAGQLQFADLTECGHQLFTISCSNGIRRYNLLSTVHTFGDFLRISKQQPEYFLVSSAGTTTAMAGPDFRRREIPWLNEYTPGWRSTTVGTPTSYHERMDGGQRLFEVVPPPDIGSSDVGKVLLPYLAKPNTLTSDTDVPFTFGSTVRTDLEPYHLALPHYGAYVLEKLRLDEEASQRQLQQFLGYVTRYTQLMEPKGPRTVRVARDYFGEARRERGRDDWTATTPYPWR